jgi:hypothetical protein
MTLARARELLAKHAEFGGGYQRHGARLVLAEVLREHGQEAVDALIRELALDEIFGFEPGARFAVPGAGGERTGD